MRWLVNGKYKWCYDNKYKIDWDKPAPSKIAQEVQNFLKENAKNYIWFTEYTVPTTRLRIDYLCPNIKIAIEVHGDQHENFIKFFHKTRSGYLAHIKRDIKKEKFLQENNYTLVIIYKKDLPLSKEFFLKTYNINI